MNGQLTNNANSGATLPTGDPWSGPVYTGDWTSRVHFGDPIYDPMAVPLPYTPAPTTDASSYWLLPASLFVTIPGWSQDVLGDKVTCKADFPGVKVTDLMVGIDGGTIAATGKRADTAAVLMASWVIGIDYDPQSAEATLEAGVLTIIVTKFKLKSMAHRVTVIAK